MIVFLSSGERKGEVEMVPVPGSWNGHFCLSIYFITNLPRLSLCYPVRGLASVKEKPPISDDFWVAKLYFCKSEFPSECYHFFVQNQTLWAQRFIRIDTTSNV